MLNRMEMIRIFCSAADCSNFREAATRLGVSPQAVTRAIKALEEELGEILFHRNTRQVHITEDGHQYVEELMVKAGLLGEGESLYDAQNIRLLHHLNAALRAHAMFNKDVEYIVKDGEIVIVDEFTGRTMPGRRWSDGLHQAVEAKEGVPVKQENQTVASITFWLIQ